MSSLGLYIHVPFCPSKCPYCDFYSLPVTRSSLDRCTDALCRALEQAPGAGMETDTVYFGGGTPLLLGPDRTARILETAAKHYSIAPGAEITLEANPRGVTVPLMEGFRKAGVNRLSMGLQSAVPSELELLGRHHTAEKAAGAVAAARQAGFDNISLDLMLGLPGQTPANLRTSVAYCAALGVEHISAYLLKIEENTPFARRYPQGMDGDFQADCYLETVSLLAEAGYEQYEISNFSRPGRESRHNTKYWTLDPYLGIGPSAHSFFGGRRFFFPRDLESFCAAENPWTQVCPDGPGGDREEFLMLRLRLREGYPFAEALARDPDLDLAPLIAAAKPMADHGLLLLDDRRISLTPAGMLISNTIISTLAEYL